MSETTTPATTETAAQGTTEPPATNGGGQEPTRLPDDHPLVTALERQKGEIESLRQKAARLDEIEEAKLSESEKLTRRAEEAESRIPTLESENNRLRAAISAGLTDPDLVDRIRGGSLEEMVEDARGLAARLAPQALPVTPFSHGARTSAQPGSMNDLIRQAAGRA